MRGIVLIPGSGWHNPGRGYSDPELKAGYGYVNDVRDAMVEAGFTVFVPNHRSAPRFTFPAPVEDVRRAVRFIRSNAGAFGIAANPLGAVGHSSGAHLAALLGVEDGDGLVSAEDAVEGQSAKVQAVVTIAAPFDLTAFSEGYGLATVVSFMGQRPTYGPQGFDRSGVYAEASPVSHVTPDDPPFLLIHGDADAIVPFGQLTIMSEALEAAGVEVGTVPVAGGSHGPELDIDMIVSWLSAHLTE